MIIQCDGHILAIESFLQNISHVPNSTLLSVYQEDAGTNANFPESFVFDLTEVDAEGEVRGWVVIGAMQYMFVIISK